MIWGEAKTGPQRRIQLVGERSYIDGGALLGRLFFPIENPNVLPLSLDRKNICIGLTAFSFRFLVTEFSLVDFYCSNPKLNGKMKTRHWLYFCALIASLVLQNCTIPRAMVRAYPDSKDARKFKSRPIHSGNQPFQFQEVADPAILGKQLKVDDGAFAESHFSLLRNVLVDQKTTAFLIVQNDSLIYEEYFLDHDSSSLLTSYSIAKSFLSALVGIAVSEGKLNLEAAVTDFIPELNGRADFAQLKVRHLLNHTSGLQPALLNDARVYYGTNCKKAYKRLKVAHPPGTVQHYQNVNSQLLGSVLTRATGQSCSEYLQEKLWIPMGMESDAFWSLDRKDGVEKSYCCINARARDFAKFGRLYLNGGNWEGQQLVPEDWVNQSIRRDTTQGSSWGYNQSWHIGLKEYGDFMADGLYKQYIYVYPRKNLVIVRMGNRNKLLQAERANWRKMLRQVADQL